jgi:hypothetical protein
LLKGTPEDFQVDFACAASAWRRERVETENGEEVNW